MVRTIIPIALRIFILLGPGGRRPYKLVIVALNSPVVEFAFPVRPAAKMLFEVSAAGKHIDGPGIPGGKYPPHLLVQLLHIVSILQPLPIGGVGDDAAV